MKKNDSKTISTEEGFRFAEGGIEVFENNQKYLQIHWREIKRWNIEKGPYVNNRFVLVLIGSGSILFSVYLFLTAIKNQDSLLNLFSNWGGNMSGLLMILFLFFFGIYVLYNSLIKTHYLIIHTDTNTYRFILRNTEKQNEIPMLQEYLEQVLK